MSDDSDSGAGYSSSSSGGDNSSSGSSEETMQPQSQSQSAAAAGASSSFLPLSAVSSSASAASAAASSVDAMALSSSSIRPLESPLAAWSPPSARSAGAAAAAAAAAGGWSSGDSLTDSAAGLFSSSDEEDDQRPTVGQTADSDSDEQRQRAPQGGVRADDEKDGRRRMSGASAALAAIMQQHALLQPQPQPQSQPQPQASQSVPSTGDLSSGVTGDLPPFRHLPASVYSQHLPWMQQQARAAESASATAAPSLPLTAENLKQLGGYHFSGGYYGGMLDCESDSSGDSAGSECGRSCSCGSSAASSVCSCVCSLGEACLCCNADVLPEWEAEEDLAQLDVNQMLVDTFGDADFKNKLANMVAQTLVGLFAPQLLPHVYRLLGVNWATKPSLMQPSLEQL